MSWLSVFRRIVMQDDSEESVAAVRTAPEAVLR